jgi:STE24 endopeptidase
MAFEGSVAQTFSLQSPSQARSYNRIKLITGISSSLLSFACILLLVAFGYTRGIEARARSIVADDYAVLLVFVFVTGLVGSIITLPMGFYSSYYIEHRYNLSNQSFARWAWERLKGTLVALPLAITILLLFYYCLRLYGASWWLPLSITLTVFSVVLARFAPVLLMPLFYKFTPIENGSLNERISRLCSNAGVRFTGIFSFLVTH